MITFLQWIGVDCDTFHMYMLKSNEFDMNSNLKCYDIWKYSGCPISSYSGVNWDDLQKYMSF